MSTNSSELGHSENIKKSEPTQVMTVEQKALEINLNPLIYGTLAEIGAGQEVARHFFRVGGAAGTIAKSMSAYDMTFSDMIYGKSGRYVSKERLIAMLAHEYNLLVERLGEKRGKETTFFVYANTVSARNFQGTNECHGWMGVRLQLEPGKPPNDVLIHVFLKDNDAKLQQEALSIIGVNLIYAAFYYRTDPEKFITSLLDGLSVNRLEVDMMELNGLDFDRYDDRSVSLALLERGLTNAVLFGAEKTVYQPSEVLRKKPLLIERGSFRPITNVNLDMMECAFKQFSEHPEVQGKEVVPLMEITLSNLLSQGSVDRNDFLARVDAISALGYKVLVTNYPEFYELPMYFRRYTSERLGMALGLNNLFQIFEAKYYDRLEGGILEAFGRLFNSRLTVMVYPMSRKGCERYLQSASLESQLSTSSKSELVTLQDIQVAPNLKHLMEHLLANEHLIGLKNFERKYLDIFSREVLTLISNGDKAWESMVPPKAAEVIKNKRMFGYHP